MYFYYLNGVVMESNQKEHYKQLQYTCPSYCNGMYTIILDGVSFDYRVSKVTFGKIICGELTELHL